MATRAAYIAALRREAEGHAQAGREHRLAAVNAELSRFDDEPQVQMLEKAVLGPISRTRPKS
jgi:hypothetical protein